MMYKTFITRLRCCLVVLIFLSASAYAQEKPKLSDIKEIEKSIAALEAEGNNGELVEVWKTVLEFKKKQTTSKEKTEKYAAELKVLEKKKTQLDTLKFDEEVVEPAKSLKLSEVSEKVEQLIAEKDSATLETTKINQLELNRINRAGLIPGLMRGAKTKLESILPNEGVDSSDDPILKAKSQADLAMKSYLQQYIEELGLEEKVIEVGTPVLKIEKRVAEQESVYYSAMLDVWKKRLNVLKARESASDKERMKQQIKDFEEVPELKAIAIENLELLEELEDMRATSALDRSRRRLDEINSDLLILKTNQKYAKGRIKQLEDAELSVDRETGQLLRQQVVNLTTDKELNREIKEVSGVHTETQLSVLKLRNKRRALPSNTEEFLNDLSKQMKLKDLSVDEARQLITEQNDLLKELIESKSNIASNQNAQMLALKETVVVTEEYSQFINERLIWIASADVLKPSDVTLEINGIRKIYTEGYLERWVEKIKADLFENKLLWSLTLFAVIFLLWRFKHNKNLVCTFHKRARRRNCQSFKPTVKGVILEMVIFLPLPLIFGFLSWRSSGMPMFEKCFLVAAIFTFLAGLAWSFSSTDGLICSNFKLNKRQCKIIHKTMGWFIPSMLPLLILFIALSELLAAEPYGRILYIVTLILTMLAFVHLFRPKHQLLNDSDPECIIAKIVFGICMLVPTILIIGTWLGYYSSAIILRNQFITSVWTIIISMFIAALLNRWFLVSSRKIAIKQALKRREALIAEREQDESDDPESKVVTRSAEEVEAEAVNVAGVKEQTTRLVRVTLICSIVFSLWGIWSQSLPALSILDKQELWTLSDDSKNASNKSSGNPIMKMVPGSESSDSANADIESDELIAPEDNIVSLQDLLFSFIIFILTYIAAKNIPGLLEITILDNLSIKAGAGFALTTTVRYLIVLFGIIWAFGNIGVTWSSIQWIAAAVTLGIGFGLQEVFANFVAGLILLYERPIRLGDVITVGEISGKVTEIKIRATTVLQFNNHELIVPNKDFITGQLVNWTLRDNIIRTDVDVGIAYGSDTELAKKVLLEVANAHPKTLTTPAPDVLFLAFGASSLDFKLRSYVAGYDDFRHTQSDLFFHVDTAFRKAGIEIAFPQQDIHIKTVEEAIPLKVAKGLAEES